MFKLSWEYHYNWEGGVTKTTCKKLKIMHITKTVSKSQYQTKRGGTCYSATGKYLRNVYCVMTSHSKDQDS